MTDDFDLQLVNAARAKLPDGLTIPTYVAHDLGHGTRPSAETKQWSYWPLLFARPTNATWTDADWGLAPAQAAYDAAHARAQDMLEGSQALAAQRTARETEQRAVHDQADADRRGRERDALVGQLKRAYLSSPGVSEQDFTDALPGLLRKQAEAEALAGAGEIASPIDRHRILS